MGARIHDVLKIQTEGLGSRVNFEYTKVEIMAILFERSLVKVRDSFYQEVKSKKKPRRRKQQDTKDKPISKKKSRHKRTESQTQQQLKTVIEKP